MELSPVGIGLLVRQSRREFALRARSRKAARKIFFWAAAWWKALLVAQLAALGSQSSIPGQRSPGHDIHRVVACFWSGQSTII